MMSVFTFMGASILRQDDSYSFRVINRVIETVFPALFMVSMLMTFKISEVCLQDCGDN